MNLFNAARLSLALLALLANSMASADNHTIDGINVQQPFNIQANLCK